MHNVAVNFSSMPIIYIAGLLVFLLFLNFPNRQKLIAVRFVTITFITAFANKYLPFRVPVSYVKNILKVTIFRRIIR